MQIVDDVVGELQDELEQREVELNLENTETQLLPAQQNPPSGRC